VNVHAEPEILFDVGPDCFFPRPKVHSSVIRLTRRSQPPAEIHDKTLFFRVVRASFAQRRKTLVNGLFAAFGGQLSKEQVADLVASCGFDSRVRGRPDGRRFCAHIQ
jgi:16S rRNA (adenine1518-N6/adenine1519-N6)-dimethyltransferase